MKENKQKKILKAIIVLLFVFFGIMIFSSILTYLMGLVLFLICIFTVFIVMVILINKGNKLENDIAKERYDKLEFDTSNFEVNSSNDDLKNIYNIQLYGDIPNQLELEMRIKKEDSDFNRIDFKQRAIARYNFLQTSLKNKNIEDLKYFIDENLYNFYRNNIDKNNYIEEYNIKYSNLENYKIENNLEYLKFNVTVEYENSSENHSGIETQTITFCREKGNKTIINKNISSKKCLNCGSSVREGTLKCEHCRQILLDDFNWKILNLESYKKEGKEE